MEKKTDKMDKKQLMRAVKAAYKAIDDKFGTDIVMLDISEVSIMAEYFIIASASNPNQLKALTDAVEFALHEHGIKLQHSEGVQSARWILLDFSYIVVHLFCQEDREYYKLDKLWGDAKEVTPEELG